MCLRLADPRPQARGSVLVLLWGAFLLEVVLLLAMLLGGPLASPPQRS